MKDTDLTGTYYECRETSEKSNVRNLLAAVSIQLSLPKLGFSSMEETLEYLFQLSTKKQFILVLDEYTYLQKMANGIGSILQTLIDQYQNTSGMKLILCGSYVNIMKSLVEGSSPLYGRIRTVIDLKPMDYYDSQKFYPSFSNEDKVRAYSVFGGIPCYNAQINDQKSFHKISWISLSHRIPDWKMKFRIISVPGFQGSQIPMKFSKLYPVAFIVILTFRPTLTFPAVQPWQKY